ncbi:MAG TPA: ATP-binding cassette domain-containing protein, partial [Acidimicrobiales bacterium]|nr:ATP-binding cassette domain-containing protein [Acidimicrobiales bacterium]
MVASTLEQPGARAHAVPPLLAVRHVSVSFGRLRVLNGVDFDVWPGQLVALIGDNGAGKSTIVRCIGGDLIPDTGEVQIAGARVRSNAGAVGSGLS